MSDKYRLNCVRFRLHIGGLWRALLFGLLVRASLGGLISAQSIEPRGSFAAIGVAGLSGVGFQLGYINARDFFTRDVSILADFQPALDRDGGRSQVVFAFGGALRILGFERTIGNVGYRGYDIDLGFRVGPGFSFSTRETRAAKNQRFNLFIEPLIRISFRTALVKVLYLEAGTTRPHVRFGLWVPLESQRI